jgi:hypothetical protein
MILNIDDDLADKITIQNLLQSLQINRDQSEELLNKSILEPYESQDLADQLRAIRHYEMVLSYYMTPGEYEVRVGKKMPQ